MYAIEINNLVKKYGNKTAVNSLSLTVEKGELLSLLGVNGAGKTTTIKILSCLSKPTSGDAILMDNSILKNPEAVKEIINVSPQETAIAPNLSVRENLEFIGGIYGLNKAKVSTEATTLIEKLGLEEVEKSKAKTLSGGMQRRLSIALALISNPQILFLDEPTLGLDVLARRELWAVINNLKHHTTIVLTTHYMEEAVALSDRVAIMNKGHLSAIGTVDQLIKTAEKENFEDAFVELATNLQ